MPKKKNRIRSILFYLGWDHTLSAYVLRLRGDPKIYRFSPSSPTLIKTIERFLRGTNLVKEVQLDLYSISIKVYNTS